MTIKSDERIRKSYEPEIICVTCNGTGWCEGSPAFTCPDCKGYGIVKVKR